MSIRLWTFYRGIKFLGLLLAWLGLLSIDLLFVQVEEDLNLFSLLPSLGKQLILSHILAYFLDLFGVFREMAILRVYLNCAIH